MGLVEWIMDNLVTVLGSIAVAIISLALVEFLGYRKISSKIGKIEDTTLNGQHIAIIKGIDAGNSATGTLRDVVLNSHGQALLKIHDIKAFLDKQKELDERSFQELSKSNEKLVDGVKAVQLLPQELMRLNGEVAQLAAKVEILEAKNHELRTENLELYGLVSGLRKQVKTPSQDKATQER